ncbi:MAG: hypothetical protein GY724_30050 [Actinomycetia bacterium]|nr:hypothetical protein [Actinomycetes bacterium]
MDDSHHPTKALRQLFVHRPVLGGVTLVGALLVSMAVPSHGGQHISADASYQDEPPEMLAFVAGRPEPGLNGLGAPVAALPVGEGLGGPLPATTATRSSTNDEGPDTSPVAPSSPIVPPVPSPTPPPSSPEKAPAPDEDNNDEGTPTLPPQDSEGGPSPAVSPPSSAVPVSPTTPGAAVNPADLLLHLPAGPAIFYTNWGGIQCVGTQVSSNAAGDGMVGSDIAGSDLRFGLAPDPDGSGSDVLVLRTHHTDPKYASGQRCELSIGQDPARLEHDEVIWQSFSIRHTELSGSSDKQIIAQWHDGDHTRSKTPFLAWYVQGGRLEIVGRHNASTEPKNETSTTHSLFVDNSYEGETWTDYVIQSRISHDPAQDPFVRIWRNGQLIVDYAGPLGYNQPGVTDYAKLGFYHWYGGNDWDLAVPTRTVWIRYAGLVADGDGSYTVESIEELMG